MATEIGSLLIDMRADVARLSQDMAKAQSTVEGAMKSVQRSAAAATTALGLIGVGVSVAGMAGVVKGAIGAMAALDDMAAKAGTTVENMSALADVAKIGGHDLSVVEGAMVRLSKALAGGDEEAKGAGKALATLGLNAEKLRAMDTADALLEVSLALDKYASGSGKTALMLDLLGKSGAAAIPYLEDLAETGRLNASVTAAQAAAAEKLEKDINAVKVEGDKMTRALVADMLPALGDIAKAMRLAAEEGGTLKALFVGFGGVANEFVRPWKAAFLALGAGFHEMVATLEEGLAKITFGGVADMHRKAALASREAARAMNLEIAGLDNRRGPSAPGEAKPQLAYVGSGKGGGSASGVDSKLQRMLDLGQKNLYGTMDSEEESRILAAKRDMQDAREEFEALQRMLKKGQDNELEAYYATAGEETMRLVAEQRELKGAIKENDNFARDMGLSFSSAFEDAAIGGKKFSEVLKGLGNDLARIILRKSVTEPLGNAFSGALKGFDFGSLFRAEGGPVAGGQSYIVGERGPELFTPGVSGAITPNSQLAAGGTSNHFTVDMRGASVEAVTRLERLVMSVNGSIERRALNVMGQARVRGV